LVQLTLPSTLALISGAADLNDLTGPRDEPIDMSVTGARAKRAAGNLLESLPVFLTLAVLSIMMNAQTMELAAIWLGLRVAYLVVYLTGTNHVRTLVWFASVICLIMMGLELV
jgi:uncharacterized MAPEG superfamily protein